MCAFELLNKMDRTGRNIHIKIPLITLQKSGALLLLSVISTTLRCSQPFINRAEKSMGKETPLFSHNQCLLQGAAFGLNQAALVCETAT